MASTTTTTTTPLKVFITGGTGFIGSAVAVALRQRGHHVTALVRDATSPATRNLLQNEIAIVTGSTTDSALAAFSTEYLAAFDVLISAAQSAPAITGSDATITAFLAASAASATKKTIIYTSGCLIYGHAPSRMVSEDDDLHACPDVIKWRAEHEKRVLASDAANGVVLRPGFVYGRSASYLAPFLAAQQKNELIVAGDGTNIWRLLSCIATTIEIMVHW
jgi:nucleoside-diphosphate-sugar epimerase